MAPAPGRGLAAVGLLALAHAAASAAQHRAYARLSERAEALPADVVLQALLAFVLACCGAVRSAGDFRALDAASEPRAAALAAPGSRPSFRVFNHRARVPRRPPPGRGPASALTRDPASRT